MKRGISILPNTLVGIVIVLLALAMITSIMIYITPSQTEIDYETCHTSVLVRGGLASLDVFSAENIAAKMVPLKCTEKNVCVRAKDVLGKKECEDNFPKINNVNYYTVDKKEDVEKVLATEMIDCWNMMGEGKVALFPPNGWESAGFGDIDSSCVICTKVAFDKETLDALKYENGSQVIDFAKMDVGDYIQRYAVPGSDGKVSYFEYIAGKSASGVTGTGFDVSSIHTSIELSKDAQTEIEKARRDKENIDFSKVEVKPSGEEIGLSNELDTSSNAPEGSYAVLFYQISTPSRIQVLQNHFKAVLGGSFALSSIIGSGKVLRLNSLAKISAKAVWGVLAIAGIVVETTTQLNAYSNLQETAGICGSYYENSLVDYSGCSVVKVVPYDANSIREMCGTIENI
jgi:hypothetical protein